MTFRTFSSGCHSSTRLAASRTIVKPLDLHPGRSRNRVPRHTVSSVLCPLKCGCHDETCPCQVCGPWAVQVVRFHDFPSSHQVIDSLQVNHLQEEVVLSCASRVHHHLLLHILTTPSVQCNNLETCRQNLLLVMINAASLLQTTSPSSVQADLVVLYNHPSQGQH